jgi:hypothetical protein
MNLRILKRFAAVTVLAALATVTAFAKDHATITLGSNASINGTALEHGNYKVAWGSNSQQAEVTFSQGKKTVATAQGKWVTRDRTYDSNEVLYSTDGDGAKKIVEIRIAGTNQALVFGDSESTS